MSTKTLSIDRFNASGCADPTVYEVLKREQRQRFGYRSLAYICSPFAGDTEANIRLARRMCAAAVSRRRIPIAPHLLFPQFMGDHDPAEYERQKHGNERVENTHADRLSLQVPRLPPS